jgi:hypothetical protein
MNQSTIGFFALPLLVATLPGCLIASSSASSESNAHAEVRIGDGAGGDACQPGDGGKGGDGGTVVIRTAEAQEGFWVENVLGRLSASGGAGGQGGQASDPDQEPGMPGEAGAAGGIALTVLDCLTEDDSIDPDLIRPLSRPSDPPGVECLFTIDPPADSKVKMGVPGEGDVLPESGVLVVEEFHLGPGEKLHVQGDLTVYAKRVFLEFNSSIRSVAGGEFAVVDENTTGEPGQNGGDLIFIAETVEMGGTLDVSGNDGEEGASGGHGGRAIVIATSLLGVEGTDLGLPFVDVFAEGGQGGHGRDAAQCSATSE